MPIILCGLEFLRHYGRRVCYADGYFNKEDKEVYIADYEHLGVYAAELSCLACPIFIRLKICGWQ